jgi:hypothetical protein
MRTLTFGTFPSLKYIQKKFPKKGGITFECHRRSEDYKAFTKAVAMGIDSHLEAISFDQFPGEYGRYGFIIPDAKSFRCLVRRLVELGYKRGPNVSCDPEWSFASSLMQCVGVEWV